MAIRKRIADACARARRDPSTVKLIAVTKNRSIEEIREVALAGVLELGENRVQEAAVKHKELSNIKWHMVGHLQTNKAKEAVKIFDLIHSVDSLRLANEINKEAQKLGKIQDILLEVKISPEATKFGLRTEETAEVMGKVSGLKNIKINGLMGIAPLVSNPEETRPYFALLRNLRDKIDSRLILSMGMTDDFEVAIEEGADMVRIGRAIFGGLR